MILRQDSGWQKKGVSTEGHAEALCWILSEAGESAGRWGIRGVCFNTGGSFDAAS